MKMVIAIMFDVETNDLERCRKLRINSDLTPEKSTERTVDLKRYYELRINPDLTLKENTEGALLYFREFAQAIRVGYKEFPDSPHVYNFARYYAEEYDGFHALPSSHREIGIVLFSNSHNQQGRKGARKLLLEENFELD